jgi:hypothetical protein
MPRNTVWPVHSVSDEHMTAERVRVDGEPVTDLDAPAPTGTRVVVWGE